MDPNHGGGQDEQNSQFLGGYCQDGQNREISVEDSHVPDLLEPLYSIYFRMSQDNQRAAGTEQHGAPQGTSDELNSLNGSHLNFGDQSVAGTEQPAPEDLEFADNAIQSPPSYDEESNQQQFDLLPADTPGIQQPSMRQLGVVFNSIDQVSPLPVSGTQLQENQIPAAILLLTQQQFDQAAATVGSCSTRTIRGSAISEAEQNRLVRKRGYDQAYRRRVKAKKEQLQAKKEQLQDENKELGAQIQQLKNILLEQDQKMKELDQKMKAKQLKLTELEKQMMAMKRQIKNLENSEKKLKKRVMMAKTVEETKNDN